VAVGAVAGWWLALTVIGGVPVVGGVLVIGGVLVDGVGGELGGPWC
jgi:hypothetical protein